MLSRLVIALLATQVILLTGCSYLKYPDVHKLTIRQGNIINQQLVDQLRPGLNRSQVRYILGTPLVADTFEQSRWDYYFSVKRPGREELRERISVHFTDDKLTHFSGDYLPSSIAAAMQASETELPVTSEQLEAINVEMNTSEDGTSATEAYSVESSVIETEVDNDNGIEIGNEVDVEVDVPITEE
ncbi:MAG: hypothetical protein DRR06_08275 [Gammaproteobacteria bacterium]|nr:MAG: hypothetical protein DRR06_08275 [Gammaproteobacteria bacterium]RLA52433.1 MAG: hypothetical protein DRR42_07605 [Gammaproteobacteria bacterium]